VVTRNQITGGGGQEDWKVEIKKTHEPDTGNWGKNKGQAKAGLVGGGASQGQRVGQEKTFAKVGQAVRASKGKTYPEWVKTG